MVTYNKPLTQMIAYWYKTYIRRFGEGAKKNEKKVKL